MKPISSDVPLTKGEIGILLAMVMLIVSTAGCDRHQPYQIKLMPAPEVYATGTVDSFMAPEVCGVVPIRTARPMGR